jgi:hypothetical protein
MEIHHPNAQPLTPEQEKTLAAFREKLNAMVGDGVLSADETRALLEEIRRHPEISVQMGEALTALRSRFPDGQVPRLWD